MTVMKTLLAGAVLASTMALTVPASAQSIGLGPDGPTIDLRSRGQRERDFRREEARRRDYQDDRAYYREQRFRDERRLRRRDYDY